MDQYFPPLGAFLSGYHITFLVFTFCFSPIALGAAIVTLAGVPVRAKKMLCVVSLGLGPAFVSWLFVSMMRWFPSYSYFSYLVVIELVLLACFYFGDGLLLVVGFIESSRRYFISMECIRPVTFSLLVLVAVVLLGVLAVAILVPVVENDAIQYLEVARMLFERHSLESYPFVSPDPLSGFYATSSHPLGFMGLYMWTFLHQQLIPENTIFLMRYISPFYIIYTTVAVGIIFIHEKLIYGVVAMALLVGTPIYIMQGAQLGIDPFRMYLLFVAVVWGIEMCRNATPRFSLVVGFVAGLAMCAHSVNLLFVLPLLAVVWFFLAPVSLPRAIVLFGIVTLMAFFFGGYRIYANMVQFGVPIYDSLPVYGLANIHREAYVWFGNDLFSLYDKIVLGLLKGLTQVQYFGISYWAFLVVMVSLVFRGKRWCTRSLYFRGFTLLIVTFYLIVVLSMFLGMHVFVANFRYLLTVQPFVCAVGAWCLGDWYESVSKNI